MPKFSEWPSWLQYLVLVPHGALAAVTCCAWWPKTDRGWRRFGLVAAYLLAFLFVMRFVFDMEMNALAALGDMSEMGIFHKLSIGIG